MTQPLLIAALFVAVIAVIALSQYRDRVQEGKADYAAAAAASAGAAADKALLASLDTWSYGSASDPMVTNGVNRFASIMSTNSVNFGFPYSGDQSAILHIRKNAEGGGYDVFITIDKGQLLSGDQGDITVKVDNDPAMHLPASSPNDNSTTALFIDSSPAFFPPFLARLEHAKTLKVQVTAYQNGNPVFVFNVSGFDLKKLSAPTLSSAPAVASSAP